MAFDGKSDHYCMNGIEAIDVIEAYGLNFALGNAVKYILRCGRKGGDADAVRDLEKARAYIDRELTRRKGVSDLEGRDRPYERDEEKESPFWAFAESLAEMKKGEKTDKTTRYFIQLGEKISVPISDVTNVRMEIDGGSTFAYHYSRIKEECNDSLFVCVDSDLTGLAKWEAQG